MTNIQIAYDCKHEKKTDKNMVRCEKKTDNRDSFIYLLWDDILFTKILPLLSIRDLFVLRGLSTRYKLLIDSYFKQMKYLNLAQYSAVFSVTVFKVLAEKCTQLKILIGSNCQWLTDDLITPLFERNQQLRKIVLNRCKNLTSVCQRLSNIRMYKGKSK
jgi:hypothetical protein